MRKVPPEWYLGADDVATACAAASFFPPLFPGPSPGAKLSDAPSRVERGARHPPSVEFSERTEWIATRAHAPSPLPVRRAKARRTTLPRARPGEQVRELAAAQAVATTGLELDGRRRSKSQSHAGHLPDSSQGLAGPSLRWPDHPRLVDLRFRRARMRCSTPSSQVIR